MDKTILTQCAKSAKTVKSSYFFAQYQRISARRGKNRATLAVAHSMLIAIYHILKNKGIQKPRREKKQEFLARKNGCQLGDTPET